MTHPCSARPPGVIHTLTPLDSAPGISGDEWLAANELGVSHGAADAWTAALEAFQNALAAAPGLDAAPEAHAVVLGNLAQAQFQVGDHAAAVRTGQQALEARLQSCTDSADAPVARIRADLAVYLAACGEHDRAEESLSLARETIEHRYGDEDVRLITILENQARLAIAAGRPSTAEPALLRLHALLSDTGGDPASLQPLLELVAEARESYTGTDSDVAVTDAAVTDAAMTDAATPDAATWDAATSEEAELFPSILSDEAFDLVDDTPHPPMQSPSAETIRHAGLIEPGQHTTPVEAQHTNPLGFEVQYGIPQNELHDGLD